MRQQFSTASPAAVKIGPAPAGISLGLVTMPIGCQPPGTPVTYDAEAIEAAVIRAPDSRNAAYSSARLMRPCYPIGRAPGYDVFALVAFAPLFTQVPSKTGESDL